MQLDEVAITDGGRVAAVVVAAAAAAVVGLLSLELLRSLGAAWLRSRW